MNISFDSHRSYIEYMDVVLAVEGGTSLKHQLSIQIKMHKIRSAKPMTALEDRATPWQRQRGTQICQQVHLYAIYVMLNQWLY